MKLVVILFLCKTLVLSKQQLNIDILRQNIKKQINIKPICKIYPCETSIFKILHVNEMMR